MEPLKAFPTISSLRLPIVTTKEEGLFIRRAVFDMCLPLGVGVEKREGHSKQMNTIFFLKIECFSKDTFKFVKRQLQ